LPTIDNLCKTNVHVPVHVYDIFHYKSGYREYNKLTLHLV